MNFLELLQNTSVGAWVRESPSLWAYPTIIFIHSAGLSLVVGFSAVIDLVILGFAPGLEVGSLQKLLRVVAVGFWTTLISGALLTVADARAWAANPIFWIKMLVIGIALLTVVLIRTRVFGNRFLDKQPMPRSGKVLAAVSLASWTAAIVAGRLTAYLGQSNSGF